jgi:hypothetical protein
MEFNIPDLQGKTVSANGWRWQGEATAKAKAKPKAKPRLPGGYTPRVDGVPGFFEDRDVDKLILDAVDARARKGTAPDRPSVYPACLPIQITVSQRGSGQIGYLDSEVAVAVVLDPESMIALVMPVDKCPESWQAAWADKTARDAAE